MGMILRARSALTRRFDSDCHAQQLWSGILSCYDSSVSCRGTAASYIADRISRVFRPSVMIILPNSSRCVAKQGVTIRICTCNVVPKGCIVLRIKGAGTYWSPLGPPPLGGQSVAAIPADQLAGCVRGAYGYSQRTSLVGRRLGRRGRGGWTPRSSFRCFASGPSCSSSGPLVVRRVGRGSGCTEPSRICCGRRRCSRSEYPPSAQFCRYPVHLVPLQICAWIYQ